MISKKTKIIVYIILIIIVVVALFLFFYKYNNKTLSYKKNTNNVNKNLNNSLNNHINKSINTKNHKIRTLSPSQVGVKPDKIIFNPFKNYKDISLTNIYNKADIIGPKRACRVLPKYEQNSCYYNYFIYKAYKEDNILYCNNIKQNVTAYNLCRARIVIRKVAIANFLEERDNKSYNGTPTNINLCNYLAKSYRDTCRNTTYLTALFDEPDEIVPDENISSLGRLFFKNINSLTPVYYINESNNNSK